jgi:LacI family transcriptional regulator
MSIHTQPPRWLAKCNGDGILARIESDQLAETIAALGIPAVDLRCSVRIHGIPQINTDDTAVVRMAVNHLRERGMRNFAFCGFATADYSVRRLLQAQQDRTANWFCA